MHKVNYPYNNKYYNNVELYIKILHYCGLDADNPKIELLSFSAENPNISTHNIYTKNQRVLWYKLCILFQRLIISNTLSASRILL